MGNNAARFSFVKIFLIQKFRNAFFLSTSSLGDLSLLLIACSEQRRRGHEEKAETREALTHLCLSIFGP